MQALIANAIHDLKNNLHVLNSWLGEAERQAPSDPLAQARALATHVNAQLVELLAVYRESEGSLRLNIDDRDLRQFIEELQIEPLLPPGREVSVRYEVAAMDELSAWAFDAYQIKLVLLDALRNAVRHARSSVVFSLRPTTNGGLEFAVSDDGAGFPEEVLAGNGAAMGQEGSGLGLRFARLIAERHITPQGGSGKVILDNEGIGGGARLRLQLP